MQHTLFAFITFSLMLFAGNINAQCEADHTVYLTDFIFTPTELLINAGESVAFINAEGTHNVDGTSENNPESFFLEIVEGEINGICMGVITFDVPGNYEYTSSVGVQPDLGMNGTITVDAFSLADLLNEMAYGNGSLAYLESWESAYAMNAYLSPSFYEAQDPDSQPSYGVDLNGLQEYTVFVPTESATEELMELMNLSQFDMLGFYDMPNALKYHVVPGIYMAADLADGMSLETTEGQSITIGMSDIGALVDDANVIFTDFTAANGVAHIIDKVLAPAGYPGATVLDVIMQSENHTLFEQAIFNEGLDDELRGQPILNDNGGEAGPFTVFAPTDDALFAFAEANGFESTDELLASQEMDEIVNKHIVEAVYESSDLFNGLTLLTLNNDILSIAVDFDGIAVDGALIEQPDLLAYNGVVHSMGELIPYEFPVITGTCGTWTASMISASDPWGNEPWGGGTLDIYANGVLIASESPNNLGVDSFSFPVDANSTINIIYNGQGGSDLFEIEDENGYVIYTPVGGAKSIYGLRPCSEYADACGPIEILFTDYAQEGWFGGSVSVYSNAELISHIPFTLSYNPFVERSVLVNVVAGPLDFVVQSPFFSPQQAGYVIYDEQGALLVEETSTNQTPPSTFGLEICESSSSTAERNILGGARLFPNPANGVVQLSGIPSATGWFGILVGTDGKLIKSYHGMGSKAIEFFGIPKGLYSLSIATSEGSTRSFRIIQQ
tara:strand:- start:2027 stop:4210 length:2184 start_codon:yes stop_codon:yes gene_type:complete